MIQFVDIPSWFDGNGDQLQLWLRDIAGHYNSTIRSLSYRFVDDQEIERINRKYLNHNYPTDIITFGYSEGKTLEGDIVIGHETVRRNGLELGIEEFDEMCRVIAHGVLHLIGFNDGTSTQKEQMRKEEEKCLILRPKNLRSS